MPLEHSEQARVGPRRDLRDILCRGRAELAELQLACFVAHIDAIEGQRVEMHVEPECAVRTLNEGERAYLCFANGTQPELTLRTPTALLTAERGIRLRYVLKKELRADPCLDIAGGRLDNHFLDRQRVDEAELQGIASLAKGLGDDEAVLIYPEGTRYTESARARRIAKLKASKSTRLVVAEELKHTLLPKIRGVAALHGAAPELDVVLFAHHGFEGFATLTSMLSGELVGRTVRVCFWRRSAATLSADTATWLDEEWRRVDAYVGQFAGQNETAASLPLGDPNTPSSRPATRIDHSDSHEAQP